MSEHLAPLWLAVRPARAAAVIGTHPRWVVAFLVAVAAFTALEWASHDVRVATTLAHIPPTATVQELDEVRGVLDRGRVADLTMVPVKTGIVVCSEAFLLWLFVTLAGTGIAPRFSHVLALVTGTLFIHAGEAAAVTLFRWAADATATVPALPWSLHALLDAGDTDTGLLLTSINLFTLWYCSALGWALSVLCRIRKSKAVLIAIAVRAVTAGGTIAMLHLLRDAYAFLT